MLREPEWSYEDQVRALALAEWEAGFCPCGCNQRIDDAYNPDQAFMVHKSKCRARAAMAQVERADDKAHENDRKDGPTRWNDGLRYYVVKADTPPEAAVSRDEQAQRARDVRERLTRDGG